VGGSGERAGLDENLSDDNFRRLEQRDHAHQSLALRAFQRIGPDRAADGDISETPSMRSSL